MEDLQYLYPTKCGCWSIGRRLGCRYVSLVEGCATAEEDVRMVLLALGIPDNGANRSKFFPDQGNLKYCPTIYLLERFALLEGAIKNLAGV